MSKVKTAEGLKKSKRPAGSIVLYVAAIIVACIGIAYLATNIVMFQKSVTQYVGQGYAVADVTSQLLLSQLLPGIYEPVAVYGGIALILFGAGMINHKITKGLKILGDLESKGISLEADEIKPEIGEIEADEVEVAELSTDENTL